MGENEEVMVVARGLLFKEGVFQGFKPSDKIDYESRIAQYHAFMKRGKPEGNDPQFAEQNPDYKQPIPYILIVSPTGKIFAYRRGGNDKDYHEKRLQGKWSWGAGGHVRKTDGDLLAAINREINEEVKVGNKETLDAKDYRLKLLGFINDDENPVGRVHIGLLYVALVQSEQIVPRDSEIAEGSFRDFEELSDICTKSNVEEWSKIALEPLEAYLRSREFELEKKRNAITRRLPLHPYKIK